MSDSNQRCYCVCHLESDQPKECDECCRKLRDFNRYRREGSMMIKQGRWMEADHLFWKADQVYSETDDV